jgi:hypothetical protein
MHTYTVQGITYHIGKTIVCANGIIQKMKTPRRHEMIYDMLRVSYNSFELSHIQYEGQWNTDCNKIRLCKVQRPTKV